MKTTITDSTRSIKSSSIRPKNILYNVCWYINGICKETLAYNVTRSTGLGIKHHKETSSHKTGIIILVPIVG